jgi:hypothetical protein
MDSSVHLSYDYVSGAEVMELRLKNYIVRCCDALDLYAKPRSGWQVFGWDWTVAFSEYGKTPLFFMKYLLCGL